jgi:hypothetical protein
MRIGTHTATRTGRAQDAHRTLRARSTEWRRIPTWRAPPPRHPPPRFHPPRSTYSPARSVSGGSACLVSRRGHPRSSPPPPTPSAFPLGPPTGQRSAAAAQEQRRSSAGAAQEQRRSSAGAAQGGGGGPAHGTGVGDAARAWGGRGGRGTGVGRANGWRGHIAGGRSGGWGNRFLYPIRRGYVGRGVGEPVPLPHPAWVCRQGGGGTGSSTPSGVGMSAGGWGNRFLYPGEEGGSAFYPLPLPTALPDRGRLSGAQGRGRCGRGREDTTPRRFASPGAAQRVTGGHAAGHGRAGNGGGDAELEGGGTGSLTRRIGGRSASCVSSGAMCGAG